MRAAGRVAAPSVAVQKEARVVATTEGHMGRVTRAQGAAEEESVGATSEAQVARTEALDTLAREEAVERATVQRVMEGMEKVMAVMATVTQAVAATVMVARVMVGAVMEVLEKVTAEKVKAKQAAAATATAARVVVLMVMLAMAVRVRVLAREAAEAKGLVTVATLGAPEVADR
eukprot:132286-Prymnesium_polylepis.1